MEVSKSTLLGFAWTCLLGIFANHEYDRTRGHAAD
jgi:hypothetical protein